MPLRAAPTTVTRRPSTENASPLVPFTATSVSSG
jgi:hypothetical protein